MDLLILMLPLRILAATPAAVSCAVVQQFGPWPEGGLVTTVRAFLIIIASAITLGAGGCLIGYLMGRFDPEYYRWVFNRGNDPTFDPEAVGLGLGLTQGMIVGLVVGAFVVFVLAWYRSRLLGQATCSGSTQSDPAAVRPAS
jgi:hypothetical protein